MSSEGNEDKVAKAAEKASTEVVQAAAIIGKGCNPIEALCMKITTGTEDVVHELASLNDKRSKNSNYKPDEIMYKFDKNSPTMKFKVSSSGKFLIPVIQNIVPLLKPNRSIMDLKSSDKDVREQRENLADAGKKLEEMLEPAKEIQALLRYPNSTIPQIAKAITPGNDILPLIYSVVTLGVIGFMSRYYKK